MGHVVIADGASVRDPHDGATRREEMHHLYLSRGQEVPEGLSDRELDSLMAQGAIAEEGSEDAKLALAGMPRATSMRRNPNVIALLGNEAEAVRAAQSAAQFPGGLAGTGTEQSESDLAKLPMASLVTFCKAFGIPVDENAKKSDLARLLANGGKDPESAADRETLRAERDRRQIESAETHPGSGVVESKLGAESETARGESSRSTEQTTSGKSGKSGGRSSGKPS